MLTLHVEATSFKELVSKAVVELGLFVVADVSQPTLDDPTGLTGLGDDGKTYPAQVYPTLIEEEGKPIPKSPRTRKPRSDAGKPRGPNARSKNAAPAVMPVVMANVANNVSVDPPQSAPAAAPDAKSPNIADARAALSRVFQEKGIEAALALLKPYKVTRVQDLKPEQYTEFIAAAGGV